MTVRPATLADLYWLRLLLGQLVEEVDGYPKITPKDLETQTAILASRLGAQDPSFLCWVAEEGQAVGGFVLGEVLRRTGEPRLYLFVSFFYVTPAWRGKGTGRDLSTAIITQAKQVGCTALEFIEQVGDTQWHERGWPTVGVVHALPLDAALTTVVSTKHPNGHA